MKNKILQWIASVFTSGDKELAAASLEVSNLKKKHAELSRRAEEAAQRAVEARAKAEELKTKLDELREQYAKDVALIEARRDLFIQAALSGVSQAASEFADYHPFEVSKDFCARTVADQFRYFNLEEQERSKGWPVVSEAEYLAEKEKGYAQGMAALNQLRTKGPYNEGCANVATRVG